MILKLKKILKSKSFLIILLAILSLISLSIGVGGFNLFELFVANEFDVKLGIVSRLPRLVSILITGASLSVAGLIMQTITRNKFVSPSTVGTMEWCRFGVMISILMFGSASNLTKMFIAFIFSLIGMLVFIFIISKIKFRDDAMIPLIGIMLGGVVSAITTYFAYQYDIIQNISSWLTGSFALVLQGEYEILYIGIPFLIIGYIYADKFTITGMGKSFAKSLGLNYKLIVFIGLIIVAIILSTIVVTVGSIPFVGLIVPNIVSIFRGDNIKNNIFYISMIGANFVLICDIISRIIIFPYEVPVSITISILGSIIFLILILRRNKIA